MIDLRYSFEGKTVWISGHTGFKGSWLCEWLLEMGAKVHGFSLPPVDYSMFDQIDIGRRLAMNETGNVQNRKAVCGSILSCQPDYVFHLAAKVIVRECFKDPVDTYATNVRGTVHVLDALRQLEKPCAAVFVTSDKVYEVPARDISFIESDPLGGADPYSSSKACAELAIDSWRRSYFAQNPMVRIASARAGNVIGGGDYGIDRIVPDCMRAIQDGEAIRVRNPNATRPFQHVLDCLCGYLTLAARLHDILGQGFAGAYNFGPDESTKVSDVVSLICAHWPYNIGWNTAIDPINVPESAVLSLCSQRAKRNLAWFPQYNIKQAVKETVNWYREKDKRGITRKQIQEYMG